ncbi:tetratricopeptide repeat protein [Sulfurovum sp.]|uniref:tetratricopeptide repeat protein n=1 Tax=Sulfurovum sp. TaxID=1969726 RepID=UPI002867BB96|nr:tetratricopeptide repeat protein [Sulfurovum sp.]
MENILPAYDDPLFSIILIIVVSLIIAILTYGWGMHRQQKEEGNLLKFLEKFDTSECALDTKEMPFEPNMLKPLILLAKAFENSGEYHKSINIYVYLIKHISNDADRLELMERLGNTYLHAGFLLRSMDIYTEILRKKPRNVKVLYELGIVYEIMHQYDKARGTLGPLKILGEKTGSLEKFLDFSELLADKTLPTQTKIEQFRKLLEEEPSLYRQIVTVLLQLDTKSAWEIIDPERIKELLDILWFLPNSQLDLDIIASSQRLKTLYYAKGYLQEPVIQSGIFSIDMLASAKQNGFEGGDLDFSYLCQKCKQSFPVSFKRCPSCMAINSVKVEEKIAKSSPKTDYSLL